MEDMRSPAPSDISGLRKEPLLGLSITRREKDYILITVEVAELDNIEIASFRQAIAQEIERSEVNLILDIRRVRHMDSTALGTLLRFSNTLRDNKRRLILAAPTPTVERIFNITSLHLSIPLTSSVEEAIQILSAGNR